MCEYARNCLLANAKRKNKTAHNFFFDILSLIWSKVNCVLNFLSHSNYGGFCIYTSHNNVSIERLQQIIRINIAILFMPPANQILNETSLVYNILVFCSPFQWEIPINESCERHSLFALSVCNDMYVSIFTLQLRKLADKLQSYEENSQS